MKLIERIRISVRDDVGPQITRIRAEHNISQEKLAAEIGVARATLAAVEAGRNRPNIELLAAIAHVLDITIDALVPVTIDVPQD